MIRKVIREHFSKVSLTYAVRGNNEFRKVTLADARTRFASPPANECQHDQFVCLCGSSLYFVVRLMEFLILDIGWDCTLVIIIMVCVCVCVCVMSSRLGDWCICTGINFLWVEQASTSRSF